MANSTTLYQGNDGRTYVDVTEAKTLAITDQGVVQNVLTDGIVVTLPATVVGYSFTIRNGGDNAANTPEGSSYDGSMEVTVSPNAADLIAGAGFTAADDKDIVNTQTTAKIGDEVSLIGNGTTGWNITRIRGTWAREA